MPENRIKHILERRVISPGGFYFGGDEKLIYTLLGSCVAVTMWHPLLHLAGMCHVVLPVRGNDESSTRYANCAVKKFIEEIEKSNTTADEYEVGVYGGGNMFPSVNKHYEKLIGVQNFKEIERLLLETGFTIKFKDVGGEVARKLTLNRITGGIILEHVELRV